MPSVAHQTRGPVVAELQARLAALATTLTTLRGVSLGAAPVLVLDAEDARVSGEAGAHPALVLELHALVPEGAGTPAAALEAAEQLLWQALDQATKRGNTFSSATRQGELRIRLLRPDRRTLCGVASSRLSLRVKHIRF